MQNKEKGCVYFFKHIGLTPIKIGYSENESPINRFNQFKTYAPFGAELIGFIRTENSKRIESELHKKYARDRVKGEWFELSIEEVQKCINFYSNLEDIEEMNNFQLAWANRIDSKYSINKTDLDAQFFLKSYSNTPFENSIEVKKTTNDICQELLISKEDLRKVFRKLNITSKVFKLNGKTISGYILFKKI